MDWTSLRCLLQHLSLQLDIIHPSFFINWHTNIFQQGFTSHRFAFENEHGFELFFPTNGTMQHNYEVSFLISYSSNRNAFFIHFINGFVIGAPKQRELCPYCANQFMQILCWLGCSLGCSVNWVTNKWKFPTFSNRWLCNCWFEVLWVCLENNLGTKDWEEHLGPLNPVPSVHRKSLVQWIAIIATSNFPTWQGVGKTWNTRNIL